MILFSSLFSSFFFFFFFGCIPFSSYPKIIIYRVSCTKHLVLEQTINYEPGPLDGEHFVRSFPVCTSTSWLIAANCDKFCKENFH